MGYINPNEVKNISDVGGVITGGGTTSNAIGILLAREHFHPGCMEEGINPERGYKLVVPKGIGHYSVKSAQMWIGAGNNLIEVETERYKYDQESLKRALGENEGEIMGLVAYAGDSRTMTVDNFGEIRDTVDESGQDLWLHADACHGFSLGLSERLKEKIDGIEEFDSITTDPHKVMGSPYTISALLVKNPEAMRTVASISDLIMQEDYAFGQITPFIGSKPWMSLKLWFAMQNIGRQGYEKIINERHDLAVQLSGLLKADEDFLLLNEVDINSVAFMFTGGDGQLKPGRINEVNKKIHQLILDEGQYHLHQFSIPDPGIIEKGTILYPLRFMAGNPNTQYEHLQPMIEYVRKLGKDVLKQ